MEHYIHEECFTVLCFRFSTILPSPKTRGGVIQQTVHLTVPTDGYLTRLNASTLNRAACVC